MIKFVELYSSTKEADLETDFKKIMHGLNQPKKFVPFEYIYDEDGSKLMTEYNSSPYYYLANSEVEILQEQGSDILAAIGKEKFNLIELGAGDGEKIKFLIQTAIKEEYDFDYIPVDISYSSNLTLAEAVKKISPNIQMTALTALYEQGIKWVYENKKGKNVFAFIGSSISSFSKKERNEFLEYLKNHLKKGDMVLMGVDLKKDPETIRMAYFGKRELGEKFIWNIFVRINRELEGNFKLENFFIYAYYDPYVGEVIGLVVSKCDQIVNIRDQKIELKKSETIFIARSKKWDCEEMHEEMLSLEMKLIKSFTDHKENFVEVLYEKI